MAALRSRDAAKQQKAIDAVLRDAHARVPRAHWAAEWTAAQALPARSPLCESENVYKSYPGPAPPAASQIDAAPLPALLPNSLAHLL